jgi:UDP-GlcNAc:undecaprenyl-phosphate GlcNAc-1-phosphate transferase
MYLWTCILSFGGLAFAVFPWQIVLSADIFATLVMGLVTAWPYLSRRSEETTA